MLRSGHLEFMPRWMPCCCCCGCRGRCCWPLFGLDKMLAWSFMKKCRKWMWRNKKQRSQIFHTQERRIKDNWAVDGHNTTTNCSQVFYFTITFLLTWNLEKNSPNSENSLFRHNGERYQIGLQCICGSLTAHTVGCSFSRIAHIRFVSFSTFQQSCGDHWNMPKHQMKSNSVSIGGRKRIRRKCISCHSMKRIPHITSPLLRFNRHN